MTPRPNSPKKKSSNRSAITDAELTVLKSLWDDGPGTVRELLDRLGTDWAYTTVQTLLGRLEDKGHVRANRRGHAHVFTAVMLRHELAERHVDEVADALLDGAVTPLVLRLVERGDFSAGDIARFRKLLKAAERRNQEEDS